MRLQAVGFIPSDVDESESDKDDEEQHCNTDHYDDSTHDAPAPSPPATINICTIDLDTESKVGFTYSLSTHDGIFYASLPQARDSNSELTVADAGSRNRRTTDVGMQGTALQRSTKGAITALLDVAEACCARKITLGVSVEHASCSAFVCSLLYLGFQVVPSRKSPLVDSALLLELDIAWPPPPAAIPSDHTYTGTSDCSTTAEDEEAADAALDL